MATEDTALLASARAGDPQAQYDWAWKLWEGRDRRQPARARAWLERAAAAGHRVAMSDLGVMVQDGEGGPRDLRRARRLFEQAAALGEPLAYFNLGRMYDEGLGVRENPVIAAEWYAKAARAGDVDAMIRLAGWYMHGCQQAIPADARKARRYLELAAERGHTPAMCTLADELVSGQYLKPAPKRAGEWYRRAAEAGSAPGAYCLAGAYEHGQLGVRKNVAHALRWYRRAAEDGHVEACYTLGYLLLAGIGTPRDPLAAAPWLERAAREEHGAAATTLGTMYELGVGLPRDRETAFAYYQEAAKTVEEAGTLLFWLGAADTPGAIASLPAPTPAEPVPDLAALRERARRGDPTAMTTLGLLMARGEGGARREPARGEAWLQKAATAGHAPAHTALGELATAWGDEHEALARFRRAWRLGDAAAARGIATLFQNGQDLVPDGRKAMAWLRRGAERGDALAQYELGQTLARGWSGRRHPEAGRMWLERAAGAGHVPAMVELASLYADGFFHPRWKADFPTALRWYRRAADAGSAEAWSELATNYLWGALGLHTDKRAARRCFLEAARLGDVHAMVMAADMLLRGRGGPADAPAAAAWLLRAAASEEGWEAKTTLAAMYEHGVVFPRDRERAIALYREAATLGERVAEYRLFFLTGEGAADFYGHGCYHQPWDPH